MGGDSLPTQNPVPALRTNPRLEDFALVRAEVGESVLNEVAVLVLLEVFLDNLHLILRPAEGAAAFNDDCFHTQSIPLSQTNVKNFMEEISPKDEKTTHRIMGGFLRAL